MPAASDTLHPQILRFAREACDELSTEQAAFIIGCSDDTVRRLCELRKMENSGMQARGAGRTKITIMRGALLAYLVRSTRGPRDVLMHSIAVLLPQWMEFAQHIAAGLPLHPAETARAAKDGPRRKPANIVPFDHPDLFLTPPAAKASA